MTEKRVKVSDITPYANNPRVNEGKAVEAVKASIERYGYCSPIIVDKDMVIIAGHTRHKALLELGEEDTVVVVSDMDEAKAKEFRLIDNKSGEFSTWDRDALLAELRSAEGDMTPFFGERELEYLMGSVEKVQANLPTQEQIDKRSDKMALHYEGLTEKIKSRIVRCRCRHCGEIFQFDHFTS
jgi:hypothetical protein